MSKKQNFIRVAFLLLTLFLLVITIISGRGNLPAFADTTQYTSVAEDLKKDSNFNPSDYPDDPNDYTIQVIQIAESVNGELFVYTYQPCQKTRYLVATEINMALTDKLGGEVSDSSVSGGLIGGVIVGPVDSADNTKLYGLTLLNKVGVFVKYQVNDFKVSSDVVRYYNITSIYREWIDGIDEPTETDNTKNAVAYAVGKCYKAISENGIVKYSCTEREVVTVTDKYVDFLRYTEGYWLWRDACDSHYIAFATDWDIDYLYEVDISYISRSVTLFHGVLSGDNYEYGASVSHFVTLSELDEGHTTVTGIGGVKHTWSRIQSISKFKESEDLSNEVKRELNGKQWVLRFADTSYQHYPDMNGYSSYTDFYTNVSEVTLLRLKFEKNGKVYNLGAVSDKVTGDDKPGNSQPDDEENWFEKLLKVIWDFIKSIFGKLNWWQWLIIGIVAIVCIVALIKLGVKKIFACIVWLIKKLCKGAWRVISLPFRAIGALFRRGDDGGDE